MYFCKVLYLNITKGKGLMDNNSPFRPMRRFKQQMTDEACIALLQKASTVQQIQDRSAVINEDIGEVQNRMLTLQNQ